MTTEMNILDFQLINTFEHYESHLNAKEQQVWYKEMAVKVIILGNN